MPKKKEEKKIELPEPEEPPPTFRQLLQIKDVREEIIYTHLHKRDIHSLKTALCSKKNGKFLNHIPDFEQVFCPVCEDYLTPFTRSFYPTIRSCSICKVSHHNECIQGKTIYIRSKRCQEKHTWHDNEEPKTNLHEKDHRDVSIKCFEPIRLYYCKLHSDRIQQAFKRFPEFFKDIKGKVSINESDYRNQIFGVVNFLRKEPFSYTEKDYTMISEIEKERFSNRNVNFKKRMEKEERKQNKENKC